jgi:hypothetical protein
VQQDEVYTVAARSAVCWAGKHTGLQAARQLLQQYLHSLQDQGLLLLRQVARQVLLLLLLLLGMLKMLLLLHLVPLLLQLVMVMVLPLASVTVIQQLLMPALLPGDLLLPLVLLLLLLLLLAVMRQQRRLLLVLAMLLLVPEPLLLLLLPGQPAQDSSPQGNTPLAVHPLAAAAELCRCPQVQRQLHLHLQHRKHTLHCDLQPVAASLLLLILLQALHQALQHTGTMHCQRAMTVSLMLLSELQVLQVLLLLL